MLVFSPSFRTIMTQWTLLYAVSLLVLGLGAYLGTGAQSATALIPAFLGIPILICGLVALKTGRPKVPLHIALVLGLLGVLGGAMGLAHLPALLSGSEVPRPTATVTQSFLFFLSVGYMALGVRSFIQARKGAAK
jgi:uncharacterized membrane protein